MIAQSDPEIGKAVATLMELNEDERLQMIEEEQEKWDWIHQSMLDDALNEGLNKGRTEGRAEAAVHYQAERTHYETRIAEDQCRIAELEAQLAARR
jgi:flagellar biosynthesis/type III secretory pathway protein FliH